MSQLFLLYLVTLLHVTLGNFSINEKSRHILSHYLDEPEVGKNRTKRHAKYPILPLYWRHGPSQPQFDQLLRQVGQLVPGGLVEAKTKKSKRELKKMLKDLQKENSQDSQLLRKLEVIEATGASKATLSDLFTYLENNYGNQVNIDDERPWSKAPFTHLGKDCFADVDHKQLTWEIHRVALTLAHYIQDRILEDTQTNKKNSQYKTDVVLTQILSLLGMHLLTT